MRCLSKKIFILSLFIILIFSGLFGFGKASAFFTENEVSQGNILFSGTLDLSLRSDQEDFGTSTQRDIYIKKNGSVDFKYQAYTEKLNCPDDFYDNLNLNVRYNWYDATSTDLTNLHQDVKYNGLLKDFNINSSTTPDADLQISNGHSFFSNPYYSDNEHWFNFSLDFATSTENFQGQTCNFNVVFQGWQKNIDNFGDGGFTASSTITNSIIVEGTTTPPIINQGMKINKVYYDVVSDKGVETSNEWVEIYNSLIDPIDINNWQICDNTSCDTIASTSTIVSSNGFAIITASSTTWDYWNIADNVHKIVLSDGEIGNGLANNADMLILKDSEGDIVDQMNWGIPNTEWNNYNENVWNPGSNDVVEGNILRRNPNGHDTDAPEDFEEYIFPTVALIYPAGGETWNIGDNVNILWTATSTYDIKIDLIFITDIDNIIATDINNSGTFNWTVISGPLGGAWVKIIASDMSDPEISNFDMNEINLNESLPVLAIIKAYKVVCDNESDLPNWGTEGNQQGEPSMITASTAPDFVNSSNGKCRLASGWEFQWGYRGSNEVKPLDGDRIGPADGFNGQGTNTGVNHNDWKNFDSATGELDIPAEVKIYDLEDATDIWLRENLKEGFYPFANPPGSKQDDESAEMYCHTDILNYDNYDYVNNIESGNTYYCIAFNAPIEVPEEPKPEMKINEVYYDVDKHKGTEILNEWVEIYNPMDNDVDIANWKICDDSSCDTITSASTIIKAKGFGIITPNASTWNHWDFPNSIEKIVLDNNSIGNGLSNTADMLILRDDNNDIVDQMNWGEPNYDWTNYNSNLWNPGAIDVDEGNALGRSSDGYDTDSSSDFIEIIYKDDDCDNGNEEENENI